MIRILAAALLLLAPLFAHSEVLTASADGDSVRLTDEPCTVPEIAEKLPPALLGDFMAGTATVSGQPFALCWRWLGESAHLVYGDGDQGLIPKRDLKPDQSI